MTLTTGPLGISPSTVGTQSAYLSWSICVIKYEISSFTRFEVRDGSRIFKKVA